MTDRPLRFHLSLNVPTELFEATVGFYTTLFGAEPIKRKQGYAKFEPVEPYVNLSMNAVRTTPSLGELDHLGIQVFSNETLVAARERVTSLGLSVRDEHEVECCYASQNKFWVKDPTGRSIEFFHVLADVERDGRKKVSLKMSANACCGPGESCG